MKKIYILFLVVFTMAQFNSSAQLVELPGEFWEWEINRPGFETPALIFTEYRGDINSFNYFEITNIGTETLDLSNFSIVSIGTYGKLEGSTDSLAKVGHQLYYIPLEGTLEPGKSRVESNVWDGWNEDGLPNHNIAMLDVADRLHHVDEATTYEFLNKPEWQTYASDSISFTHTQLSLQGSSGYYLEYKFKDAEGNRDSTLIDNVNISIDPYFKIDLETGVGSWGQGNYQTPVAGVGDAIDQYILVRKSTVTQGNLDWRLARGTDLATSEWLPVPVSYNKFDLFTTVGVHGNYSLDYTAKNADEVKVDVANKTITLPWNTVRGETLNREFTLGTNMSWSYIETATDSAYSNVQEGDVFSLYAVGDDIEQLELTVKVQAAAADVAVVFPKRKLAMDEETGAVWWPDGTFYGVTNDLVQDSIYNVAYSTPIDTLFKYLDKPAKASWAVVLHY